MTATQIAGGTALDDLEWLEGWYAKQCNGEWEHQSGVKIETLDNPGWMLTVELRGTDLEGRASGVVSISGDPPSPANGNVGGPPWTECSVRGGQFVAAGDPTQLRALLRSFRAWATDSDVR